MLCVCFPTNQPTNSPTSQHARPIYLPAWFDVVSNVGRFAIVSFKAIQWIHHAQQITSWIQHARINSYYWISILPSHHHMPVHVCHSHKNQSDYSKQHSNQMAFSGRLDDRNRPHDLHIPTAVPKMCVTIQAIALFNRWWCRTLRTG